LDEREVVIIGAGPAGTSAGFFLKNGEPGTDVLMIDRLDEAKYSRYHRMCGEAISRQAFRELAPIRPMEVVHNILKVREEWPGGRSIETSAVGYILDRPAFLRNLLARYRSLGGEQVRDAVEKVEEGEKGTVLTLTSGRTVLAKNVIAADGASSVVRKTLFKEEPPIFLWTEQHLVKRKVRDDTITFIQAERYKGGYRWEFPAGGLSRIGFPRGADSMEGEDIVESHRRAIPMGGLRTILRGNVYLAGDSAAMANPLTAGGIRVAMLSGKKAAEAVLGGRPMSYQKWWSSSRFSSEGFMRAFLKLKSMTDSDYERASRGFGSNPLRLAWCYLRRPEFRDIYRSYPASGIYGW
jgi:flavin-dependent dehydrogenase